jgi:hypothetical protein
VLEAATEDPMNDTRLDSRSLAVLLVLALVTQSVSCDGDPGTGSQTQRTGTLRVQASTTGPPPFFVYFVGIDGEEEVVPVNGVADFELSSGPHQVHLSNAEPRCSVAGENPRTITVSAGAVTATRFEVTCPPTGAIEVTASTTGVDADPDGYLVTVNGSQSQHIGVNASVTFSNVAAGERTVELTGLAANCSVTGDNPRSVTVTAGETAQMAFAVVCTGSSGGTGSIAVTTSTTGVKPDSDGYAVVIFRAGTLLHTESIGTNATVEIPDLAPGDYYQTLSGLASNCSWAPSAGAHKAATVSIGTRTRVTFDVTCFSQPLGTLRVRATTTGPPPFFYFVGIDGQEVGAVAPNGAASFRLPAGAHTVALFVGSTCTVTDNNRTVDVVSGSTVEALFQVTC